MLSGGPFCLRSNALWSILFISLVRFSVRAIFVFTQKIFFLLIFFFFSFSFIYYFCVICAKFRYILFLLIFSRISFCFVKCILSVCFDDIIKKELYMTSKNLLKNVRRYIHDQLITHDNKSVIIEILR